MPKLRVGNIFKASSYIILVSGEKLFVKDSFWALKKKIACCNSDEIVVTMSKGHYGFIFESDYITIHLTKIVEYGRVTWMRKLRERVNNIRFDMYNKCNGGA